MRRDVRLILEHAGERLPGASWGAFDRAVPVPRVGVCIGHLVDRAGRRQPRFPEENVARVARALGRWIDERNVRFGFVSGAAGADLLFDEAIRDRGGESHLLLPYDAEAFVETERVPEIPPPAAPLDGGIWMPEPTGPSGPATFSSVFSDTATTTHGLRAHGRLLKGVTVGLALAALVATVIVAVSLGSDDDTTPPTEADRPRAAATAPATPGQR